MSLRLKQPSLIYYLYAISGGRRVWYVARAFDYAKLRLLEGKIRAAESYDVRNFAEVLYAGYDERAPQEVLDVVNAEFGTGFVS